MAVVVNADLVSRDAGILPMGTVIFLPCAMKRRRKWVDRFVDVRFPVAVKRSSWSVHAHIKSTLNRVPTS